MSRYIDLKRIEFVVTDACSGRCKPGSLCGWGEVFIPKFDLVVFVDTPKDMLMTE